MRYGFDLYIDEAGDGGFARVRPLDPNGSSEYFVMCGVLIRAHRHAEVISGLAAIKERVGLRPWEELHFRDLDANQQVIAVADVSRLKLGLVAIVSNKRNMRGYRNPRVEAREFEIVRERKRPRQYNHFYNHLFRYVLERASKACAGTAHSAASPRMRITFSHRDNFLYSQTRAYLRKLNASKHPRSYFNNKRQIDWSSVDISAIYSERAKREPMLQIADVVASAIYRGIDADRYGDGLRPEFIEMLAPLFLKEDGTPSDFGFKLLPDGFNGPLTAAQKRGLASVDYRFP